MNKLVIRAAACAGLLSLGAAAVLASAAETEPGKASDDLYKTVAALDQAVFDAFNRCSSPEQLKIYASYFSPNLEFYHDNDGVTWTRQDMVGNTAKNACGNYRRELVAGSLNVYPVKDYGAIEQGVHRFCQIKTGECTGLADFVIIWTHQGDEWQITRALSYGHRPLPGSGS